MAENPPKISQFLWQHLQELPKIDPEGLLEASFDQYLIQARCQTLKNRVRSAQERPQEVHDHAKPLQNGAQDTPKSSFGAILEPCFCHSKFISFLHGLFLDFLLIFQRPTGGGHDRVYLAPRIFKLVKAPKRPCNQLFSMTSPPTYLRRWPPTYLSKRRWPSTYLSGRRATSIHLFRMGWPPIHLCREGWHTISLYLNLKAPPLTI